MAFEKGHGKVGGRGKGTPNRLTRELRQVLKELVDRELKLLPEHLESLDKKERIELLLKLIPYVLPRVQSISMSNGEPIDFSPVF